MIIFIIFFLCYIIYQIANLPSYLKDRDDREKALMELQQRYKREPEKKDVNLLALEKMLDEALDPYTPPSVYPKSIDEYIARQKGYKEEERSK